MARTVAQRKADQRRREAAHLEAVGASRFSMDMYQGTREALARIVEAGGFEQPAEALTVLIHNADNEIQRDMSQIDVLLNVARLRETKR